MVCLVWKIPHRNDKMLCLAKSTVDNQIFPYTKFFISNKAIDEQGPLTLVYSVLWWMAKDTDPNTIQRLRYAVALRNFIQEERTTTLCGGK